MTTHSRRVSDTSAPRRSCLGRELAASLAITEYARVADLLDSLTTEQWLAPTECTHWDVRAMAGHMLGMVQMLASVSELARQQLSSTKTAKRDGGPMIDALTALQVAKNAELTTSELIGEVRRLAPKAARNRRRAPGLIRNQTMEDDNDGTWTFGYLFDVILTRDPFLHRVDITRACGAEMVATADHEGVIVSDVVHEWAQRHGEPYTLELTGPAGGRWGTGEGERITMDAFDFCRTLSGRGLATGLLTTQVPF